jgi:hypothetical protein
MPPHEAESVCAAAAGELVDVEANFRGEFRRPDGQRQAHSGVRVTGVHQVPAGLARAGRDTENYRSHLSLKISPKSSRMRVLTRWMLRQRRIPLELEFIVQGGVIGRTVVQ